MSVLLCAFYGAKREKSLDYKTVCETHGNIHMFSDSGPWPRPRIAPHRHRPRTVRSCPPGPHTAPGLKHKVHHPDNLNWWSGYLSEIRHLYNEEYVKLSDGEVFIRL